MGKHLVEQALEQGHHVTAFSRTLSKLVNGRSTLRIVPGDVLDPTSVEQAILNHDAVLCVLAAERNGSLRLQGTDNIVRAMQKRGVRRLNTNIYLHETPGLSY